VKKGAQKEKGHAYERDIAAIFTEVYYPDGGGEFRRVPLSGGWDKRVAPGDIIPLKAYKSGEYVFDKSFPFSIECKNYRDENVKHFFSGLYSAESIIYSWASQALNDSRLANKIPLVVFKLYRAKNIIMIHGHDFGKLTEIFGIINKKQFKLVKTNEKGMYISTLVFLLLSDFTEWIDWDVYRLKDASRFIRSYIDK
jgi:hypothetical protein